MSSTSAEESTIDDKYSVSLDCRYDDDVAAADNGGNEWEGAWTHSNLTLTETTYDDESSSGDGSPATLITMAEVRRHNMEDDVWMVLENKVYDLTDYIWEHPGGPKYITSNAGMDATDPFTAVHFGVYARPEIKEYYIGDLDMNSISEWVFEISRSLRTDSVTTDAQFEKGKSVDFGFSFWVSLVPSLESSLSFSKTWCTLYLRTCLLFFSLPLSIFDVARNTPYRIHTNQKIADGATQATMPLAHRRIG